MNQPNSNRRRRALTGALVSIIAAASLGMASGANGAWRTNKVMEPVELYQVSNDLPPMEEAWRTN